MGYRAMQLDCYCGQAPDRILEVGFTSDRHMVVHFWCSSCSRVLFVSRSLDECDEIVPVRRTAEGRTQSRRKTRASCTASASRPPNILRVRSCTLVAPFTLPWSYTWPFQWLQMRIQEERERRELQAKHLERMPAALQEIHDHLADCIEDYTENFGANSADIVHVAQPHQSYRAGDERDGTWQVVSKVEVVCVSGNAGIPRGTRGLFLAVEFGLLPSDKLFYRDRELDKYLTMDEFTRRILDRALFPALREQ